MEEKKIATSVDLLINIDRFEHLQITKYSEKKITYETPDEMVQKEDQLTQELIHDVMRTIRAIPEYMRSDSNVSVISKKMGPVSKIEEKIVRKMPTWLEDGIEPNIANTAKKNFVTAKAEEYVKKEENTQKKEDNNTETEAFLSGVKEDISGKNDTEADKNKEISLDDEDLFGDEDLFDNK